MSTRIRYTKKKNKLVSVRTFVSTITGAKYKVELLPEIMEYRIINQGNRAIIARGDGPKRLDKLKIKAKRRLKELGVVFETEVRDK